MGNVRWYRLIWNIKELKSQIKRLYFSWLPLGSMRTKFLRKHNIFAYMGENVFWQPRIYPSDGEMIKIHNNVTVATDVRFIMHDISWMTLETISFSGVGYNCTV